MSLITWVLVICGIVFVAGVLMLALPSIIANKPGPVLIPGLPITIRIKH